MAIIGVLLNPGDTGAQVHELHEQLRNVGAVLDTGEQSATTYGPSTVAAVRTFRQQHDLPADDAVDPPTARLMHVAAVFASPDGQAPLRAAVRAAAAAADTTQPQELYWLARYAVLAGDDQTALTLARRIPDHSGVKAVIEPILALPDHPAPPAPGQLPRARQQRSPELPYPENFYTYRRDFYPLDVLNDVQRQIAAVGLPPRDPNQAGLPYQGEQGILVTGILIIETAVRWFEALRQWQIGNAAFHHQSYAAAQAAYDACQSAACDYFSKYYNINIGSGLLTERLRNLLIFLANNQERWPHLWSKILTRRGSLSLEELQIWSWAEPPPSVYIPRWYHVDPPQGPPWNLPPPETDYGLGFIQRYFSTGEYENLNGRQLFLEAPLIMLAFVLVPLARAEANRARRQFEAAFRDLRWVLDAIEVRASPDPVYVRLACERIEVPFAKVLLAETMLDKADTEHKARIAAEPPPAPDVTVYQGLRAAQTYLALKVLFSDEGEYVARVDQSREALARQVQERVAARDTQSPQFQLLGKDILVPTLRSASPTLPGLDRRVKAHEPLLTFTPPDGQEVMRETNPRIYAALLTATARLELLKAGFNYLGYLDTYVPPWRFQFLLERARYFAGHAKNAQREYLNFLSNAEREEFQELSASQNVDMEKSNVRIETARVDQVLQEVEASFLSKTLAELTARNAGDRVVRYYQFGAYAERLADDILDNLESANTKRQLGAAGSGAISGAHSGAALGPIGSAVGAIAGAGLGWLSATGSVGAEELQLAIANEERSVEKKNLIFAEQEASKAAEVANAQYEAANAGLVVAGLQRQAALLRHEFAVQNLEFLRSRVLNAEQWYRLVAAIRSISETYLRYGIELAFLAEQAYEFEADKRINVIRFDYDLSEVGNVLAADFLLRDLDTLEQDLVVTQRQRQQQVRYVLSMAREFPEALQEIRDNGWTTFSLRLEQLEKRFPGLYNLRIGAVEVLPVALMDSTRFSLELTHLGTSQVRLKAQPDTPPGIPSPSPLNTNDLPIPEGEWLAGLQETWPVKLRVTGPETAVFSGLTRQDANAVFAFATAGQRQAFEALGAAAAWEVDFTARENQVVPGTLADLLITLTLSGYYDAELRSAMDRAPRPTTAVTRWLSGRSTFPDALYEFNRSGRMAWNVTRELLTLTNTLGAVRNVAVLLLPTPGRANYFGRIISHCEVQVRITSTGNLEVLSELPQVTFTLGGLDSPLVLTAQATVPPGAEVSWEFGDGSARQTGTSQQHTYEKPGRYTVNLRVVRNGRLSEFRGDVVVSRSHAERLSPPVTAIPTLTPETGTDIPPGHTRVVGTLNAPAADPVIAHWRVGDQKGVRGDRATFDLPPGDYTVFFTAVRRLKARVYCNQRALTGPVFDLNGLSLASNRSFDPDGTETTGTGENPPANPVAAHLFAAGALSPVDDWTVELPLSDNACLRSVAVTDVEQYGLAEIEDVLLAFEYETTPGGPLPRRDFMTNIITTDQIRLKAVDVMQGTSDPAAGAGLAADIGSLYLRSGLPEHGRGQEWLKTGSADLEWSKVPHAYNVREFGAKGDGSTDDRIAITNAMLAASASGGVVFFPPGIYMCGQDGTNPWSLDLPGSNITLLGVKGRSWIKHLAGMAASVVVLRINSKTNVTIRDLGFDGNWGNALTQVSGLSPGATLPQSTIHVTSTAGFPGSGTFVLVNDAGTQNITYDRITETTFENCAGGAGSIRAGDRCGRADSQDGLNHPTQENPQNNLVMIQGGENILLSDCLFQQSYGDMVWIGSSKATSETFKIGAKNVRVHNCDGFMSARHHIALAQKCAAISVASCRFQYAYIEPFDSEADNTCLRDVAVDRSSFEVWWNPSNANRPQNIAMRISGGKVVVPAETNFIRNVRVQGCTLIGSVMIQDASDVLLQGNRIVCDWDNYSFAPVLVQMCCDGVRVLDNWIYDRTTAHPRSPLQHAAAVSIHYYGNGPTNLQPSGIQVGGNKIFARNGRHGIKVAGTGTRAYGTAFQPGVAGTATAVTDTTLTDSTAAWTTDQWVGYRVRIGLSWGSIVSNTATVLTLFKELDFTSSWTTPLGDPSATPAAAGYVIFQVDAMVDVFGNQIDCSDDGRGAGGFGIYAASDRAGMKVRLRENAIKNATADGIHIHSFVGDSTRPFIYLRISDNHVWDDQLTPTCAVAVRFDTAQVTKLFLGGNENGEGVATLYDGLTTGRWRTTEGGLAGVWEGFGSPDNTVTDRVGALYRQLDGGAGSAFWVKESGTGNTGWVQK